MVEVQKFVTRGLDIARYRGVPPETTAMAAAAFRRHTPSLSSLNPMLDRVDERSLDKVVEGEVRALVRQGLFSKVRGVYLAAGIDSEAEATQSFGKGNDNISSNFITYYRMLTRALELGDGRAFVTGFIGMLGCDSYIGEDLIRTYGKLFLAALAEEKVIVLVAAKTKNVAAVKLFAVSPTIHRSSKTALDRSIEIAGSSGEILTIPLQLFITGTCVTVVLNEGRTSTSLYPGGRIDINDVFGDVFLDNVRLEVRHLFAAQGMISLN